MVSVGYFERGVAADAGLPIGGGVLFDGVEELAGGAIFGSVDAADFVCAGAADFGVGCIVWLGGGGGGGGGEE